MYAINILISVFLVNQIRTHLFLSMHKNPGFLVI